MHAQIDLRENQKAVEAFRHLNGRLPTTLEELRVLSARPGGDPILIVVRDPWKNSYLYETKGAFEFTITCLGADGAPGGEGACKDIVVHGPPAKDSFPR